VCIDDASRIAFNQVMRDERNASAVAFLEAAVVYYASLGVTVERVMTDNGSCYLSRGFGQACNKLGLKHIKTKPHTPNQRQGRALHPNKLARMGLGPRLRQLRRTHSRVASMAS
jgi:transposase InsO family protein